MNLLVLLLIVGCTAFLGLGIGIGYVIKAWRGGKGWRNIGKTLTVTLPEIPGSQATIEYVKARDGTINDASREPSAVKGNMDKTIIAGPATYGSNLGPLAILTSYGHSLIAPSKFEAAKNVEHQVIAEWVANYKRQPKQEETKEGGAFTKSLEEAWAKAKQTATRFLIWDPLAYWKACQENDMQDLYNSTGAGGDPWYARLLVIGVFAALGLVLLLFGVVVLKVLPALQAAHTGT